MIPRLNSGNPEREIPHNGGFMGRVSDLGDNILYEIFSRFSPPPTNAVEAIVAEMTPEERTAWDAGEPLRCQIQEEARRAKEVDTQRRFNECMQSERENAIRRARTYEENLHNVQTGLGMTPESTPHDVWKFQQGPESQNPWYSDMKNWTLDPRWADPEFRKSQARRYADGEFDIPNTHYGNRTVEASATGVFCQQELYDIAMEREVALYQEMGEFMASIPVGPDPTPNFQARHRERFEGQSTWERLRQTVTVVASSSTVRITVALGAASIFLFGIGEVTRVAFMALAAIAAIVVVRKICPYRYA